MEHLVAFPEIGLCQCQSAVIVEGYRDLQEVFEVDDLPRRGLKYVSYQLLRNVLVAHAFDLSFACFLTRGGQT